VKEYSMDTQDFECFKLAFQYVQQHRFANMHQAVEELHLVDTDGNLHPEFRTMLESVYRAIQQGRRAVEAVEVPPL
jgi:hypothetical protein